MGLIHIPREWGRQPTGVVRLAPEYRGPLNEFVIPGNTRVITTGGYYSKVMNAYAGDPATVGTPAGRAFRANNDLRIHKEIIPAPTTYKGLLIAVCTNASSASGERNPIAIGYGGTNTLCRVGVNNGKYYVQFRANSGAVSSVVSSETMPLDTMQTMVGFFGPANGDIALYVDGDLKAAGSMPTSDIIAAQAHCVAQGRADGVSKWIGDIALAAFIRGDFTLDDARRLSVNPWQIFERQPLLIPVAGGGAPSEITGDSTITLDQFASASTGAIYISGLASLSLDETTAATTGTLSISGTSTTTIDDVDSTGSGGTALPEITGDSSVSLDNITDSGTGTIAITGAATSVLDTISGSGSGNVVPVGGATGYVLIDAVTSIGTSSIYVSAAQVAAIDSIVSTAGGEVHVHGTGATLLDDFTATGYGSDGSSPSGALTDAQRAALYFLAIDVNFLR